MLTANESYLLELVLEADKQIVAGYPPGLMSATIKPHSVALADAKTPVAFFKARKKARGTPRRIELERGVVNFMGGAGASSAGGRPNLIGDGAWIGVTHAPRFP